MPPSCCSLHLCLRSHCCDSFSPQNTPNPFLVQAQCSSRIGGNQNGPRKIQSTPAPARTGSPRVGHLGQVQNSIHNQTYRWGNKREIQNTKVQQLPKRGGQGTPSPSQLTAQRNPELPKHLHSPASQQLLLQFRTTLEAAELTQALKPLSEKDLFPQNKTRGGIIDVVERHHHHPHTSGLIFTGLRLLKH